MSNETKQQFAKNKNAWFAVGLLGIRLASLIQDRATLAKRDDQIVLRCEDGEHAEEVFQSIQDIVSCVVPDESTVPTDKVTELVKSVS